MDLEICSLFSQTGVRYHLFSPESRRLNIGIKPLACYDPVQLQVTFLRSTTATSKSNSQSAYDLPLFETAYIQS